SDARGDRREYHSILRSFTFHDTLYRATPFFIGPLAVPLCWVSRGIGFGQSGSGHASARFELVPRTDAAKMSVPPLSVDETLAPANPPVAGSADDVITRTEAI